MKKLNGFFVIPQEKTKKSQPHELGQTEEICVGGSP
jgi:hypothetical protein